MIGWTATAMAASWPTEISNIRGLNGRLGRWRNRGGGPLVEERPFKGRVRHPNIFRALAPVECAYRIHERPIHTRRLRREADPFAHLASTADRSCSWLRSRRLRRLAQRCGSRSLWRDFVVPANDCDLAWREDGRWECRRRSSRSHAGARSSL